MSTETKEININLPEGMSGLTVLHGDAPKPIELKSFSISGDLDSPKNYFERFSYLSTELETLVELDMRNHQARLVIGYNHPHKRHVTGELMLDPNYKSLDINSGKYISRQLMVDRFKFMRTFFPKVSDCMDLIAKLKTMDIEFSRRIVQSDDERGNRKEMLEQVMGDTGIPESITLCMPIILGEKPRTFTVDLLFDIAHGKEPVFTLQSLDANDAIILAVINKFSELEKYFAEKEIAVLNVH